MKCLATAVAVILFWTATISASEVSVLARVTVYWRGERQQRACSNGARLRAGHCAVDPGRIPYGSRILFPDATCVAVDSGPDVVNRKAARLSGRTAAERNAIVIDRFFERRQEALSWANAHPQFMTLRVVTGEEQPPTSAVVIAKAVPMRPTIGDPTRTTAKSQDLRVTQAGLTDNHAIQLSLITNALIPPARP